MKYETPDMAIIEPDLIAQYEILASSTGTSTCNIAASVQCSGNGGVNICTANSAVCGKVSYCTTKSS